MKTGNVQKMEAETVFAQHHINAFESLGKEGPEIVLDISPSFTYGLRYVCTEILLIIVTMMVLALYTMLIFVLIQLISNETKYLSNLEYCN